MSGSNANCDEFRRLRVSRRGCLRAGTLGAVGLSLADLYRSRAAAAAPKASANSVIFLFIAGGVSHIDTLDPKPEAPAEVRSVFAPLETNVSGIRFTDQMPRLAKQMHRLAVIRSMRHPDFQHETAWETTCSGWGRNPALTYPNLGSVVSNVLGERNNLPGTISVPGNTYMASHSNCFSNGYLSPRFRPFAVSSEPSSSSFSVRDISLVPGIDSKRLTRRRGLLEQVDACERRLERSGLLEQADQFEQAAFSTLLAPEAKRAFAIDKEPQKVRDAYGMTRLGQRFLLARRLVEAGVAFATVDDDSWDHHSNVFELLKGADRLPQFDQAYAALLADLADRGLLDSTMVAYTTEFGRTPQINKDAGRDHYPLAYTQALSGGGIRGGQVLGSTDATGAEPKERPVSVADYSATLLHALGIRPDGFLEQTTLGRPMPLTQSGQPVLELF